MKLRYKIVIVHLLLYPIFYFMFLSIIPFIPFAKHPSEGIIVFCSIVQVFIALVGFLFGLAKKNNEIKYGFFIAALNAVVVNL
ncbi:MAG TPA: hypothetical protein VKG26_05270 [Bacteroidia bacterium]|nr:hypothetical protein [Bacteroidia bacterium]